MAWNRTCAGMMVFGVWLGDVWFMVNDECVPGLYTIGIKDDTLHVRIQMRPRLLTLSLYQIFLTCDA